MTGNIAVTTTRKKGNYILDFSLVIPAKAVILERHRDAEFAKSTLGFPPSRE
jgi:hypothetical protein